MISALKFLLTKEKILADKIELPYKEGIIVHFLKLNSLYDVCIVVPS